jgi:hypothetical protein
MFGSPTTDEIRMLCIEGLEITAELMPEFLPAAKKASIVALKEHI